jgi:hypothetical protein
LEIITNWKLFPVFFSGEGKGAVIKENGKNNDKNCLKMGFMG